GNGTAQVTAPSVEAGVRLARWFAREARRVYATFRETDSDRDTRALVNFVARKGGRVTARDLQRSNRRKYPTAGPAEKALNALVRAGLGRWEESPSAGDGGRPSRSFVLRPTADKTDETPQNTANLNGRGGSVGRGQDREPGQEG